MEKFNKTLYEEIVKVAEEIKSWDKYIQPVLFTYRTKELRISKQSLYKLVYERKSILVMDYGPYGETIIKRLLKITDKVPQLKEMVRKTIRKA